MYLNIFNISTTKAKAKNRNKWNESFQGSRAQHFKKCEKLLFLQLFHQLKDL